jgi:hypothetical protein
LRTVKSYLYLVHNCKTTNSNFLIFGEILRDFFRTDSGRSVGSALASCSMRSRLSIPASKSICNHTRLLS